MPVVPPNEITDVPRKVRQQLEEALFERAVLQYAFSYSRLAEHMSAGDMESCVIGFKEEEVKAVKSALNDRITSIYTENGIDKTLRHTDPFGRRKDYIMMEGTSTSFSQNRALEIAVSGVYRWICPECDAVNHTPTKLHVVCSSCHDKVEAHNAAARERGAKGNKTDTVYPKAPKPELIEFNAEALTAVFKLATTQSTYVTLQARDVKEGK